MPKKVPNRKCVVCQQMKPKKELWRIVANSAGEIFLDRKGKENGRGAYLCRTGDCIDHARKNKGLERSLKQPIPIRLWDELKEFQEGKPVER